MAEPLKTFFSKDLAKRIAASIAKVHPKFPSAAFVKDASAGLDGLELLARARHMSEALHAHLPDDYEDAVDVLLRSLGPVHAQDELLGVGMGPFFYLPHTTFVATHGLDHFDVSMRAQHALTQRFTCEFSIRPFLARHREKTVKVLRAWTKDPSAHVRRLVSEGTRPYLPWGSRVPWLVDEPDALLPFLEALKDDPSTVVRRSVANHLNDHARNHPDWVCDVAERWLRGASEERRALVDHALRSRVKAGDRRALTILGFGGEAKVEVTDVSFSPKRLAIGGSTRIDVTLVSRAKATQSLAVDLVVHFVKARGESSPKVFKIGRYDLPAKASRTIGKSVSLAVHTTRKPYAGRHRVDVVVNGRTFPVGAFDVTG
ncbi:MAG: DNA alkylation repair protein [Polyangiaceae bacterium]